MDQCEALMKLIMEAVKNGTDAKTDSEKKPEAFRSASPIAMFISPQRTWRHFSARDMS